MTISSHSFTGYSPDSEVGAGYAVISKKEGESQVEGFPQSGMGKLYPFP